MMPSHRLARPLAALLASAATLLPRALPTLTPDKTFDKAAY
jgi:hypothetical protein